MLFCHALSFADPSTIQSLPPSLPAVRLTVTLLAAEDFLISQEVEALPTFTGSKLPWDNRQFQFSSQSCLTYGKPGGSFKQ